MRGWRATLLALAFGVPLQASAFLGMNAAATLQGPLPAWTKQLGSKGNPLLTEGLAAATDSSGNVYAAGVTKGGLDGNSLTGSQDFFVTKYDSTGAKLWTKQLGVASRNTTANGVATDSSGNVFVAGWTSGGLDGNSLTGSQDFFVTKYDSTGAKLWTKQLGAASQLTTANGVATDSSGNVFVAGWTTGGLDGNSLIGSYDAFLTKYTSNGTKIWTKQWSVPSHIVQGFGVATDSSGNIFVTGSTSAGMDGNTQTGTYDFFVTKFDSIGTKLWTKQLGVATVETDGIAVAIDPSGNIFVAGWTWGGLDGNSLTGTIDSYVTKFDSTGTKLWTKQSGVVSNQTLANGVATDSSGNVFVAGSTRGGLDGNSLTGYRDVYVTKYDPAGTKLWTKQLGTVSRSTSGYGAATDSSGNVYTAGYTDGDLDGNTLTGTNDTFITKYSTTGSKLWTRQNGSVTGSSGTVNIGVAATDASGNVYVAGYTNTGLDGNTQTGTNDFFVTMYNPAGARLWTQQLGVASKDTEANAVATDSSGNVFVAGYTTGGLDGNTLTGAEDFFVTKYNSTGTRLWTRQLGVTSQATMGNGVATDPSGNVFVTGYTTGGLDGNTLSGPGNNDFFVTEYNASGTKQWTRQLGSGGTNTSTYGNAVAADSSGNVFVAGYTTSALDGQSKVGAYDMIVTKYDSAGNKQWTRELGASSGGATTYVFGAATDSSGSILVTGYANGGFDGNTRIGTNDLVLAKLDSAGNKKWTRQMGVASKSVMPSAVTVDPSGNSYVTGFTNGGFDGNARTGSTDTFVTKYTSGGLLQWTKQFGVASKSVYPGGIAIDPLGHLYVAGTTSGGLDGNTLTGAQDFFVSQYIGN